MGGVWRTGQVVDGRYEVVEVHEDGGMGLVYRVRHLAWGTDLAVKSPRPELFRTAADQDRFTAEAEIWVSLGLHPNVCGCHYVRVLDGLPRVFAEYVTGGSLRDWIGDRRLYAGGRTTALGRILDVAVQCARGLQHAHDQGVVHQDVKPANILLDVSANDLVAKVTDFGLARACATAAAAATDTVPVTAFAHPEASALVSNAGLTPAYASPEQMTGQPLGRRTDVYSFGASVLEMFAGGITWVFGAVAGEALAALREQPTPGLPELPPALAALLERCLRLDPAARPASMAEVAAELTEIHRRLTGTPYRRVLPAPADLRADELNNRGISMLDLGRPAEAGEMFAAALGADPQHLNATYNAGLLAWRRGERTDEDVLVTLDAAASVGADADEARRLLAEVHRERRDQDQADALLHREITSGTGQPSGTRRIPWYDVRQRDGEYDPSFGMWVRPADPSLRIRFTEDGTRAVSVCDGLLRVWNVREGRLLRESAVPIGPHDGIVQLGISADGRFAVTAAFCTVRFWDLEEGRCLRVFDAVFGRHHTGLDRILHWPNSVHLSGDGRVAVVAYHGGVVLVWDFPSGSLRQVIDGHDNHATAAVSNDGRLVLAAGRYDATARLWDVDKGRLVQVLDDCGRSTSAFLSADADLAAVASNGRIRVWELTEGRDRTLDGVGRLPQVSVTGGYVVSTDVDDTVRLWPLAEGRCLRTLRADGARVLAVHLDAESGVLQTAWQDGLLRWWTMTAPYAAPSRLSRPREHGELALRAAEAAGLLNRALRADHPRAALDLLAEARAVPGHEREPRLLAAWRELGQSVVRVGLRAAWAATVYDTGTLVDSLDMSADGRFAASSVRDGTVRVWDLDKGTCRQVAAAQPHHAVGPVGISDDGARVMYRTSKAVTTWSVETGDRTTLLGGPPVLGALAFDCDRRLALIAQHDAIRLWNLETGACERQLPLRQEARAVWLGRDLAVSAGRDGVVRLWDLETGRCRHTLRGHTHWVLSVCLSPDGRQALSSGGYSDRTIRLWDTATGECLRVFGDEPDSPRGVNSVPQVQSKQIRFTPDGRFVVSGGSDTTVRIWDPATGRCLRVLEGHRGAVSALAIAPDARFVLSGDTDGTIRRWEMDWDLETH
ncbi:protein kinase domain-containing protein [Streptomyces atratus]|uniref:WD40 repeat domain-containing serine/threonine protein kinase n=1 Tax=Streptomyces atratus TaxID=1893 RepID=UPI002F90831D